MKVIFLDVDGVLNCRHFLLNEKWNNDICKEIDIKTLPKLKRLIDSTGAKVVLSSSWRQGYPNLHIACINLIKLLKLYGIEIMDITPLYSDSGVDRGDEIRDWLNLHKDIESFVILDDWDCMCEFTETNFVRTSFYEENGGLQDSHIEKAIEILNRV